jgi:hypothetical protein
MIAGSASGVKLCTTGRVLVKIFAFYPARCAGYWTGIPKIAVDPIGGLTRSGHWESVIAIDVKSG